MEIEEIIEILFKVHKLGLEKNTDSLYPYAEKIHKSQQKRIEELERELAKRLQYLGKGDIKIITDTNLSKENTELKAKLKEFEEREKEYQKRLGENITAKINWKEID